MNWKLIFSLSLFGLFMGVATVYFIPMQAEWYCWLVIFIVSAYLIAKNAPGKYFLHGFVTSLANCVWIIAAHVLLYSSYMAYRSDMAAHADMPLQGHHRLNVIIMGPIIGVISGLVLGLFAFIASKLVRKPVVESTQA